MTVADPRFAERKRRVDLARAIGLSAAIYELFVEAALPREPSGAECERLYAAARMVWRS